MSDAGKSLKHRYAGLLMVVLLSVLSLEITIIGRGFLEKWEPALTDIFMKWRKAITYRSSLSANDDIVLIAIDQKTQNDVGRFGAGKWLSRRPFVDNIRHLQDNYRPSVLAYDIVFIDDLALSLGQNKGRISESRDHLKTLAENVLGGLQHGGDTIPMQTLENMNRLVIEQGNKSFANAYAGLQERDAFDIVFGFYFRGGGVDPQVVKIEGWSDWDVHGDTEDGDEDMGGRIPYLKDIAIPDSNIHFPNAGRKEVFEPSPNAALPTPELLDYGLIAPLNVPRDDDGVVRRIPMVLNFQYLNTRTHIEKECFVPSFSLMAALLHLGVDFPLKKDTVDVFFGNRIVVRPPGKPEIVIPVDGRGRLYLNYDKTFDDFDEISFSRMRRYEGRILDRVLNNRVAIVGVTLTGFDVGATPLDSNIPLVFVQMTAISNILDRNFIAPMTRHMQTIFWTILFLTVTTICHFEKTFKLGPLLLLFGIFYFILAYTCIHQNICIMPVIQPFVYLALCAFSILSYRFFTEEKARRKIRGMFSTMVSDKVLTYLEENPQSFSLQGRNIEATVFFSDVASFTSISETLPPEKLTELLNKYLTPITNCIMESDGYVDKYVGDCVMAVWGAPNPDPDHARKACKSALEQQELINDMNQELQRDYGVVLSVRIGINSGIVTAGNMGSEKKFQYTVMGDTVNLASRLEPVNKDFGTRIIIGDLTHKKTGDAFECRMLENIVVKGKKEIVPIYELLGTKGSIDNSMAEVVTLYEEALYKLHNRQWDDCLEIVNRILGIRDDEPTRYLKNRAELYKKTPPPDSWLGEYTRTDKD